jgi:hypothetical protein
MMNAAMRRFIVHRCSIMEAAHGYFATCSHKRRRGNQ